MVKYDLLLKKRKETQTDDSLQSHSILGKLSDSFD